MTLLSMGNGGWVYIITNSQNTTLYIGVTSDLLERVWRHKANYYKNSFSARYKLYKLVYFEGFGHIEDAIFREKQLKGGNRKRKVELVNSINPNWKDLYPEVLEW